MSFILADVLERENTDLRKENQALREKLEVAKEQMDKLIFALQCMIINKNGKVPGITDQELFDSALLVRDEAKNALKELEK